MSYILHYTVGSINQAIATLFHFLTANSFNTPNHQPLTPPQVMKNIVILGGSYTGVSTAHRILKQAAKIGPFKITLVSPNTHFYWNIASPRALIAGQIEDEKMFKDIKQGFEHYPEGRFEFIVGLAEWIDVEGKKVRIGSAGGEKDIGYDYLVLATGSHMAGEVPFKGLATTEETRLALHKSQEGIRKAKRIVVAGAGATGVEFCGELASEYGAEKEIILITSSKTVLAESTTPAGVQRTAAKILQSLKVDIKFSTRVISSSPAPNHQTEVLLSNGEKIMTDFYIPAFGLVPNSSYVPNQFLNDKGFVKVDEYFGLVGTDKDHGAEGVYAIGDVCGLEPLQFVYADRQSTHLAKNLVLIFSGKIAKPYKPFWMRIMGVSIGKKQATGHFGRVEWPNFLGVMVRKDLFLQDFEPIVFGTHGDSPI